MKFTNPKIVKIIGVNIVTEIEHQILTYIYEFLIITVMFGLSTNRKSDK